MKFVVTLYNVTGPWTEGPPSNGGTTATDLTTVYMEVNNIVGNVGDVTSIKDANGTELIITSDWVSTDNKFNIKTLRPATHGGISFHLPTSSKTILTNLPTSDTGQDLNWWYGENRVDELTENLDTGIEGDEDEDNISRYVILSKVTKVTFETTSFSFFLMVLLFVVFLVLVYIFYVTKENTVVRRNL